MTEVENTEASRTYDPAYFDHLVRVEDRHFWFRARNGFLERVLVELANGERWPKFVLEVGSGTGNTLRVLERAFPAARIVGTDLYADGFDEARRRTSAPLVQCDLHALAFRHPFDVACLFDVLEHLPDDVEALSALREHLAPDGRLVLSVPASPVLWSDFDEAAVHQRRYDRRLLRQSLEDAGYAVERLTSFMSILWPLIWVRRKLARSSAQDRVERAARQMRVPRVVNGALYELLRLETAFASRGRGLPFGTSLLAIARPV